MALELPKPVITEVTEAPTDEELRKSEHDFNEANRQRFQRVEFWMQQHIDMWTDSSFNRDVLCREVGINRQLLLQSVRSQGYNNLHDFINSYRMAELKRRIQMGSITTPTECMDVGFGTVKTVRSTFLRFESTSLDDYLQRFNRRNLGLDM